jgi:hypothetical protein
MKQVIIVKTIVPRDLHGDIYALSLNPSGCEEELENQSRLHGIDMI